MIAGAGVVLGTSVGTSVGTAQSATSPTWNCRASAVYIDWAFSDRFDPIVANGNASTTAPDRESCVSDVTSNPAIDFLAPDLLVEFPLARTTVTPADTAPRNSRTNTATSQIEKFFVEPGVPITADAVFSEASVSCDASKKAAFTGRSYVTNLTIAGNLIPLDDGLTQLSVPINATTIALINVNEQLTTTVGDTTTMRQTALSIELLPADGQAPLFKVVLGETKVSQTGNACLPDPPPPTITTTKTTTVPGPTTTVTKTTTQTVPGPTTTQTQTQTQTVQGPAVKGVSVKPTSTREVNGDNGGCGKLTMFFQTNRKKVFGVRFAKERVVTRGRLVACNGKSIRGARIDVIHVLPDGTRRLVKTGLRSRELGRITLILPRNLFTRKLEFRYRADLSSSKVTSIQTLKLNVRDKRGKLLKKAPKGQGKVFF